jgi:hypothetical protein
MKTEYGFNSELWWKDIKDFAAERDAKYPMIAKSWRNRWNEVIPFFKFSPEIRKAVYTTNAIESVNYTIQKTVKHRQSFSNDDKINFYGNGQCRYGVGGPPSINSQSFMGKDDPL